MKDSPLVSVVTASYNMGHYVVDAVESVLAQDYPHIEIIVVNDGSQDDTKERLAKYSDHPQVQVIHQENGGQTVAKNRGLAAASGDYVGFCDADNCWRPGKLVTQLDLFNKHPEVGVIYGDIALMDSEGNPLPPPDTKRYSGKITGKLLIDNFVTFNTTLVPRRIIEEMGGFDEKLRMGIDYDLWLRISLKYDFLYVPELFVDYRIWGGQMSNRTGERMENFFKLLQNFLDAHPEAVTPAEARQAWAHSLTTLGNWQAATEQKGAAIGTYSQALRNRPHDMRTWKSLVKMAIGRT